MSVSFTESVVEDAALAWLESIGYTIKHGPEIAPGELFAERADYAQMVLSDGLRDTPLPKLLSGEIRVKDAQSIVQART